MGKVKIAETLCRAGLHLGVTTVGRMLKEQPRSAPKPQRAEEAESTGRVVFANYPNHVWHADLTAVPIGGFWCSWLPLALPQCWPFCWWVALVVDHYTRRIMGCAVFRKQPNQRQVHTFLARTFAKAGLKPKYLITDQGPQFHPKTHRPWCRRHGVKPRFGAIGKHGSVAVIERLILTLKTLCTRRILVPLRREDFRRELLSFADWYNEHRPHRWLGGKTPNEVYFKRRAACHTPRWEPRARWPRGSPCARPVTLIKGQPGVVLALEVRYHAGRKHLPIVYVKRAA